MDVKLKSILMSRSHHASEIKVLLETGVNHEHEIMI